MTDHLHQEMLEGVDPEDPYSYLVKSVLEITCGEAPFLTTRYDPTTGELIPFEERFGMLDRKLQYCPQDNSHPEEWVYMTMPYVFGYELSGDSLMIARINIYMTCKDFIESRDHVPALAQMRLESLPEIIRNNIFQMDGLTGMDPATGEEQEIMDPDTGKWVKWSEVGNEV